MRRFTRWLYIILIAAPITLLLGVVNVRLYYTAYTPDHSDVVPQLAFIKEQLLTGTGEEMQGFFPEGYFFSYTLYGLAWVDVGLQDTAQQAKALDEARWALQALESDKGTGVFSASLTPPYGVFYAGWSNWLRGGILKLQTPEERDPAEVERFQNELTALAAAFDANDSPFLQAYPGQAWPVDSTVAVAALHLHDTLFEPQFEAIISRWVALAKTKLDPTTGLLPHRVSASTGDLLDGTRGSSQSVIQRFLPEIDPTWAAAQYPLFRQQFASTILGIPGIREYPIGTDGIGDVDSGPLIGGMSLSASVVTVAAARVEGDNELADALLNVGEALGMPVSLGNSKRYALGVLPIGDAFLAWAKSASPWTFIPQPPTLPELIASWWRLPIHILSLVIITGLWWKTRRSRQARHVGI
ncbi:MAG: hypothetical protein LCI00_17720 [Chloroflexi bacterium]|nr:hypothetical protein [Chloroflexota bacterium]MCC6893815.1 hypothetical protein [Anaerolineae bacterium]